MIEIKNLSKSFKTKDKDIVALSDINLKINDNEIFGIIGLSGAGKSTLVRTINLLERPTTGDILIDGDSLLSLTKKELLEKRRNIGMIFQNFNLLEQSSVIKNICFPLEIAKVKKDERIKRARYLLDVVGLSDKENSYPSSLSGGERQRVPIARALSTNPKYLLCDEPTSALDPQNTSQILSLLKEINKNFGVTIIIITHEMKVVEDICDRVAVIDSSSIVEIGNVKEVFINPKSKMAHDLLLRNHNSKHIETSGGERIRVTFDGLLSKEPIISNMILELGLPVNILYADTKDIDGIIYGHMILELPKEDSEKKKILLWLEKHNISYKEEKEDV